MFKDFLNRNYQLKCLALIINQESFLELFYTYCMRKKLSLVQESKTVELLKDFSPVNIMETKISEISRRQPKQEDNQSRKTTKAANKQKDSFGILHNSLHICYVKLI